MGHGDREVDGAVDERQKVAGVFDRAAATYDSDKEQWHRWSWSVGQRAMWEAVPDDRRDSVRALAYERLDGCRDSEGRIGFDQVVRFTLAVR